MQTLQRGVRGRIVIALFVLAWCATALGDDLYVADTWLSPDVKTRELKKILIVGITSDRDVRRHFENRFVSYLRGRRYDGVTSHSIVPDLSRIENRREILDTIAELQVDSVITVRLVPMDIGKKLAEEWIASWEGRLETYTSVRQLIEESLPDSEVKAKRYGVEVALWTVEPAQRIWAARSSTHTRKQLEKGVSDFVLSVMDDLKLAELL